LGGCDKLPSWLATEKPPAPMPSAAPVTVASAPVPAEPPATEWSHFNGPPDAVLEATRITLRVDGAKSFTVNVEHDGSVEITTASGCGTHTIPPATVGSLLAFVRTNGFFAMKATYEAEGKPTAQDEVHLSVRTPAATIQVIAERGSHPPKALGAIVSGIETATAVDAHIPKLKPSFLTQEEVERAVKRDKAKLAKCQGMQMSISVDRLGTTTLANVLPAEAGPCVLAVVTGWKFGPACSASSATVTSVKNGVNISVTQQAQ
jgi:hypothetical protein